jgi:ParB family chromosome partitioning protein
MEEGFYNNSIYWIEIGKIKPNPFQPRVEFDQVQLQNLADSIRQYGILQPLVVSRHETFIEDEGLQTEYELIAGERRLRASKIAGLSSVPVIIRASSDDARTKLELAIIENLQREDLNPVDRARAFDRLAKEFGFKHNEIAKKVGKSREYVSNTIRLLGLPPEMMDALSAGKISEGHTRPLLMLIDRPEEQTTLFKEIMLKRLTVREAESISRRIATDKVRKREYMVDPEITILEKKLAESLGTRVHIERKETGGQLTIDFFSTGDLQHILDLIKTNQPKNRSAMMERFESAQVGTILGTTNPELTAEVITSTEVTGASVTDFAEPLELSVVTESSTEKVVDEEIAMGEIVDPEVEAAMVDDRSKEDKVVDEENLYSVTNFTV